MYKVEKHKNGSVPVYWISADGRLDERSFGYIDLLKKQNKSPNTLKRYAWSITYFYNYLTSVGVDFDGIGDIGFFEQVDLLRGFLLWLKSGKHKIHKHEGTIKNKTCNDTLKDVLHFYSYLVDYKGLKPLSVLRPRINGYINSMGLYRKSYSESFDFMLDENEDETYEAHIITEEEGRIIFGTLKNVRDRALLMLMIDTGIRIGEVLGIKRHELDIEKRKVKIQFSSKNENGARAKRGEYRVVSFSKKTQQALHNYITRYENILSQGEMLFIKLQGRHKGKGMEKADVDSVLRRLEEKTGIHIHSHLLRHKFAEERDAAGWETAKISMALGHRSIRTTETYLNSAPARCEREEEEFFKERDEGIDISCLI